MGAAFIALRKKIMEPCELIKERKNIQQTITAMIRCIRTAKLRTKEVERR